MKDNLTISTAELFKMFPDAETARKYLEARLWPDGPVCPHCHKGDHITVRKGGYYRCNTCVETFTVRTGTIFGRSHVPLDKWLHAIYLLLTARKGISSVQLSKELSITQKSAWFVLQRLREACGTDLPALRGIVEADETFVGGKEKNKHGDKKRGGGHRGTFGKTAVFGMRERGPQGRTIAKPVSDIGPNTLQAAIVSHVEPGTMIHTDEHGAYAGLPAIGIGHESVSHAAGEYVRDGVTTNSIESVWAVLKRGLHGVYHHASEKHLGRYVDEFAFRLSDGNVRRHTMSRVDSLVNATVGKRITYKELIA